jgi:hypothetical protein
MQSELRRLKTMLRKAEARCVELALQVRDAQRRDDADPNKTQVIQLMPCLVCSKPIPKEDIMCDSCSPQERVVSAPIALSEDVKIIGFCVRCSCEMTGEAPLCPDCEDREETR